MPKSLVTSPQSTVFGGQDEPTELRIRNLERKIAEMDDRAAEAGGLSPANIDHYNFIVKHKELEEQKLRTGDDIHLVIRPVGVLQKPGVTVRARIVCALPENAAEILAFAAKRNQAVRLATAEEIQAYKDYNAELKRIAEGRIAAERAHLAQIQLQAVLGQAATAINVPALAQEEVPPEPTAPVTVPHPGAGLESPIAPDGGPLEAASASEPAQGDAGLDPDIVKLGSEKQVTLLIQAGYSSVDQVAEASPADLAKINGIGEKSGAKLIVKASEIVAMRADAADSDAGDPEE